MAGVTQAPSLTSVADLATQGAVLGTQAPPQPVTYTPPPAQTMLPTAQMAVQNWGVDPSAYGYANVQPGYDIVESAKNPIRPGGLVSQLDAMYLAQLNADANNSINASSASARKRQLIGAQNDPTTYVAAQQIMRQTGMPADKALHVAMTQNLASNGHYLGLGASLPASQQAVDALNSRDFELATMFGLPEWNAVNTGGAFNIGSSGFTGYKQQPGGSTSLVYGNNVVNGVDGNELLAAGAFNRSGNYQPVLQQAYATATGTNIGTGKASTTKSNQLTPAQVQAGVNQAISRFNTQNRVEEKKAKEEEKKAKATPANATPYGT